MSKKSPVQKAIARESAGPNKIEWKRDPGQTISYRKEILVDGIAWGYTLATGHGMHGKSYEFVQIGGSGIMRKSVLGAGRLRRGEGEEGFRSVIVRSFHAKKAERGREDDLRPTEQRIVDEARALIAEGLLRHPDEQARFVEENRKKIAEAEAKRETTRRGEWGNRVAAILTTLATDFDLAKAREDLVDLMKWAQSQ